MQSSGVQFGVRSGLVCIVFAIALPARADRSLHDRGIFPDLDARVTLEPGAASRLPARGPDHDGDGIPDALDKCPNDPEDFDGFQDSDGCPDDDNAGDGIPDKLDKCPNEPETFNGFEDEDGCPDTRSSTGPEERPDRIDLKGAQVGFTRGGAALTAQAKTLLNQVAAIIKSRRLTVRVEVHVPLGVKSANAGVVAAQKRRDKLLAQQRAQAIQQYLVSQGVPIAQVQAVGIGSDRPLGASNPTDPVNERVDLIKAQQGGTP